MIKGCNFGNKSATGTFKACSKSSASSTWIATSSIIAMRIFKILATIKLNLINNSTTLTYSAMGGKLEMPLTEYSKLSMFNEIRMEIYLASVGIK